MRGSASGSTTTAASSLILNQSIISTSTSGVECNDKSCITFEKSKIINCTHYGIVATSDKIKTTKLLLDKINETKYECGSICIIHYSMIRVFRQYDILLTGECKFQNCSPNNIAIFNKSDMCLIKNNITAMETANNGDVDGVNCSSLEMEDCNQTNGIDTDISTTAELEDSVIVVDD